MESGKVIGGLILCAVFVFIFFVGNRKKIFRSINWKKGSDLVAVLLTYLLATGILFGLYVLVLFAITLIVG